MIHRKVIEYLRWLAKPPQLHDVWTYNGVWILNGVTASLLYRNVFVHMFDATFGGMLSGLSAVLLIAFLLHRIGFAIFQALIISVGGMFIAAANWTTVHLELDINISVALTIVGIGISLPLFCRGVEIIRPK
jgi:hypothetical protein